MEIISCRPHILGLYEITDSTNNTSITFSCLLNIDREYYYECKKIIYAIVTYPIFTFLPEINKHS